GYYRGLFENAMEDYSREQVSGLLLLYSSHIFLVIESCSSTVHLIIQDLASLQNQGHSALLQEIKVVVVAHNIPTRLFTDWYMAVATSPMPRPHASTQSESTVEVVAECLTKDDDEDTDDSVHTFPPELLIPAEKIQHLCNAEQCASPEDFVRMYLCPSQPALDS
ncbi:TEX47 protein, partial [Urocolius indicus]|nr:TEX47 protein [Urocolius indicus]